MKLKCVIAATFLCVTLAHAQELKNGDFGQDLKWWQVAAPKNGEVTKEVTVEGPEGKSSLKITVGNVGPINNVVSLNQSGLLIEEGTTYTISFWAKCDTAPKTINVSVSCMNAGLKFLGKPEKVTLTTEWAKYTYTFKPTLTGERSQFSINNLGDNNTSFYFADFQLVSGVQ